MSNKKLDLLLGNVLDQISHIKDMNEIEIYNLSLKIVDEWSKLPKKNLNEEEEEFKLDLVSGMNLLSRTQGISKELIELSLSCFLHEDEKTGWHNFNRIKNSCLLGLLGQNNIVKEQYFRLFDYLYSNGIVLEHVNICKKNLLWTQEMLPYRLIKMKSYINSKQNGTVFNAINKIIDFYNELNSLEILEKDFKSLVDHLSKVSLLYSVKKMEPIKPIRNLELFMKFEKIILEKASSISQKEIEELRNQHPYSTI